MADAIELHRRKYRDDGQKKKEKEKKNKDNNNEPPTNNETAGGEEQSGNGNNNNNEKTPAEDTISAHLNNGEDDKFEEALLIAARNNDPMFDMTEPDDYSLASKNSEESLAGAHFGKFPCEELEIIAEAAETGELSYQDEENFPDYIKFTLEELEKTVEDFQKGSN